MLRSERLVWDMNLQGTDLLDCQNCANSERALDLDIFAMSVRLSRTSYFLLKG